MNFKPIKEKYLRPFIISVVIGIIWYFADLNPRVEFANKSVAVIITDAFIVIAILTVVAFIAVLILKAVYDALYDFFVVTKWKKNERAYYIIALVALFTLFTAYSLWSKLG